MVALVFPPCLATNLSNSFSSGYFFDPMNTTENGNITVSKSVHNCRTHSIYMYSSNFHIYYVRIYPRDNYALKKFKSYLAVLPPFPSLCPIGPIPFSSLLLPSHHLHLFSPYPTCPTCPPLLLACLLSLKFLPQIHTHLKLFSPLSLC